MGNSTMDLEFITHQRSERSGIYHADNVTNGHGEVGGSMSTIKEGQRRGGIGAADNVWQIGETKRGASVPHSLDALGVWALSWLDCDRVPRIRSEEHTSELQSLMRISFAVFCLKNTKY